MPPDDLPPRAVMLLELLRAADAWLIKIEMARAMRKVRFTTHDTYLLDSLVDRGLVEVRRRDKPKSVRPFYEYKATMRSEQK